MKTAPLFSTLPHENILRLVICIAFLLAGTFHMKGQTNLAQMSTAIPSQNTINGSYVAANALDGNTASISATAQGNSMESNWWQIDLGNYYQISSVVVKDRADCCQGNMKDFYVIVSDVPFNTMTVSRSMTLNEMTQNYEFAEHRISPIAAKQEFSVGNKVARYIRVEQRFHGSNGRDLAIGEVEVKGNPTAVSSHTPTPQDNIVQITSALNSLEGELGSTVSGGEFITDPNVKRPQNFSQVRTLLFTIANQGRQDANYRKKYAWDSKLTNSTVWATDLSGNTVTTDIGTETLYKPCIDLTEDEKLRKAAQYHAEHMAKYGYLGHVQNQANTYNGQSMRTDADRLTYFQFDTNKCSGEACSNDPDPQAWMSSNTHFRPFFNVGSKVTKAGFGLAQSSNGTWYACALFNKVN